ncbi:MAG: hypothetical protein ACYDB7_05860 [Mycobacteriales bacterium]
MAALTSEEKERLLLALREDAAFRDEVRRALLAEELLDLPDRFAAFVVEMHTFVVEMHTFVVEMHTFVAEMRAFVAEVHEFVAVTERRLGALEASVGTLKGTDLERRVEAHPRRYLTAALAAARTVGEAELLAMAGDELDERLTEVERADLVVRGRLGGEKLLGVVEVSWRAHSDDVERAHRRASVLADMAEEQVLPIVVSAESPGEAVTERARSLAVTLVVVDADQPLVAGRALAA